MLILVQFFSDWTSQLFISIHRIDIFKYFFLSRVNRIITPTFFARESTPLFYGTGFTLSRIFTYIYTRTCALWCPTLTQHGADGTPVRYYLIPCRDMRRHVLHVDTIYLWWISPWPGRRWRCRWRVHRG